jgi:hypothetical protein
MPPTDVELAYMLKEDPKRINYLKLLRKLREDTLS